MAVLQVYQAKLLSAIDESEPDPATVRELRSATDLALRATKTTAQAIGRSMASLVVLKHHLWLTLMEIKDADKVSFLDAPISPNGLFGPAVEGFPECFTEAQKASQAMRHFLPKHSSSAAAHSHPKPAPTQQPAKLAPAVTTPQPAKTQQTRGCSCSARRHPFPKRLGPRPRIVLDPAPPASSWSAGQEEERAKSHHGRTAHQTASLKKTLLTPFISGCRGNCVCCKYRARTSAQATIRCDSGKNKTQTFSKREQISLSVTRVYPTPCHTGRGLAVPPRSVRLGYGDNKTRLFTPIRSKTPAFQRRGLHLGAGRERSRSTLRGDDVVGNRSHRKGSSSSERVRLLQPLLPRPQKGWRPPAHPWSQTPESRPHEEVVQDDHAEADPLADSHRGLVLFSGPERHILSHPDSPHHRQFLRFAFDGVAYQYTVLRFGLSLAPRTFTKCMDAALSPLRQMGIRILNYLDDWLILAQSEVELLSHRTLLLSHLERLGLRVNFAKSTLSPSQRVSLLGTVLDSAQMRAVIAPERALAIQKLPATFKSDTARPLKAFQKMLGLMATTSPVLQLGLLRMRPLQRWLKPRVPPDAWRALAPWKNPWWMEMGVAMGMVCNRKVVTTDTSNTGWGALCEGKPTFGHWLKAERGFHINCLEMLAVCRAW